MGWVNPPPPKPRGQDKAALPLDYLIPDRSDECDFERQVNHTQSPIMNCLLALCVGKKRRSNARFYEEFKILSKTASL